MALVLDASAIAPLALSDEDAAFANKVLVQIERDGYAIVPPLFWNELLNVFAIAERRGRIAADVSDRFLDELVNSASLRTQTIVQWRAPLLLARRYGLTAYDACYLALALETQSALATLDQELCKAAEKAGVAVFSGT